MDTYGIRSALFCFGGERIVSIIGLKLFKTSSTEYVLSPRFPGYGKPQGDIHIQGLFDNLVITNSGILKNHRIWYMLIFRMNSLMLHCI